MRDFSKHIIYALIILVLVSGVYALLTGSLQEKKEVIISELVANVQKGEVRKITVQENNLEAELKDGSVVKSRKEPGVGFVELMKDYGVTERQLEELSIEIKEPGGFLFWLGAILPFLIPVLIIGFFLWWMTRQAQRGTMQAFSFGQSKARLISPGGKERVMFKDVAGVKEAKEELKEIVDFLKNPKKFLEIGAKIPKGVLLMGPPGSGKTLLAKAVSGEAGVPFFHMSASEFIEMFVGVGASVTDDTPILIREKGVIRLQPIQEVVNRFYKEGEENFVVPVAGLETLGMRRAHTGFRGFKHNPEKLNLGGSQFVSVKGVYRHRVDTIYEIYYRGGMIRATGDHSIFVREKNYIRSKRVNELKANDCLVNLPFKVRSTFIQGRGTTHKVKSHEFDNVTIPELVVWEEEYSDVKTKYEFAREYAGVMTQKEIAVSVGASQATIGNWISGKHSPKFFNRPSIRTGLPSKILVTPDLMRLLGYYLAEGRTEPYSTQFVFGMHEAQLHQDCVELLRSVFSQTPAVRHMQETNSTRITVSSRALSEFFTRHCGTGSHHKHLPEWAWSLPWNYIYQLIKGYSLGDGYITDDRKLCVTSVSQQLIRECAWLLSMHGIQVGVGKTVSPAGRVIRNRNKPLPKTVAWRLTVGKTSNLWEEDLVNMHPNQFKKPKILKVVKKPYQGYVYDLVGCEGEAFFGGEKPLLLHNSRTRDLFRMAKKTAPSIIFIDELDAVGRVRGAGLGGGHDEREQTLNQILVEMDGMETDDRVIVVAATNRPDVLDPALLRPGRFDRRVVLDLPDINDREEILKIHAKNKPLMEDVKLRVIAERTPGFSGADLENLVNEAAILAARENRKKVAQMDLILSIEKVMLGPERKSRLLTVEEKKISAYHEGGHALVAASVPHADPVHKISIVSRGRAAGYTLKLPSEERHLFSRSKFLDELAVWLGGYAAEKVVFNELTTGAADDLAKATDLARNLVTRYGMSDKVGPTVWSEREEMVFLGRELATERNYSEDTARMIDKEVKRLIDDAFKRAKDILSKRRSKLVQIAKTLIEKETIEREEFEKLMKQ